MNNLYLYTYNSDLPAIIKMESLKNIILDELFELFSTELLRPKSISQHDKVILNYVNFLFATKQKMKLNARGIEISNNEIKIDCSGKINNFEQILYLKQLIKQQIAILI